MNWNEIIITSIKSFHHWPIAIVIIIYILRQPIGKLIEQLAELKIKCGDFSAEMKKFEEKAKDIMPPKEKVEEIKKEITYSPVTEIISTWSDVENACKKILEVNGKNIPLTFRAIGSRLKSFNLIDDQHGRMLDNLRQLRNIAVRGRSDTIDSDDAAKFIGLAEILINHIDDKIKEKTSKR